MRKIDKRSCLSQWWISGIIVGLLFLLFPTPATAQDSRDQKYRKIIREALAEFDIGNYEEACSLLRQAHQVNPNARTLRGLGMASFEARKYVDAIVALLASLKDQRKPLTDQQRVKVKNLIARAEVLVGYIDLRIEPPSATFTEDGRKPTYTKDRVLADPGERQIVVNAEGYRTLTRQLSVRGGSTETVALTLEPLQKDTLGQPQPVQEIETHEKTTEPSDDGPKVDADSDWVP